ncbi:Uncharacterized protein APZ42_028812 [Daphnia magna]|uniref:Uncharacterized protein n=2 Tax=Daphnia magna TaxID=35525 RepID=A0A0P5KF40_9CRUS|nr:hypothetical protein OUZ56_018675 [Daphnia magna]KZS07447.1 Uncharacterized protein APZ42_028812 [Daphnia magna]
MAAAQSSSKISQLIRRGWIEIPDIMVGLGIGAFGLCFGGFGLYRHLNREVKRPFKDHYIVKRDDDPDAEKYLRFHQNPKY